MILERGFEFLLETVRLWEENCAPLITEHLRKRREVNWIKAGMWTKHASRLNVNGVTSIEPEMET